MILARTKTCAPIEASQLHTQLFQVITKSGNLIDEYIWRNCTLQEMQNDTVKICIPNLPDETSLEYIVAFLEFLCRDFGGKYAKENSMCELTLPREHYNAFREYFHITQQVTTFVMDIVIDIVEQGKLYCDIVFMDG
jgi:hypothetical protein